MQVSIDNDELEKKVAIALKGINGRSLAQALDWQKKARKCS